MSKKRRFTVNKLVRDKSDAILSANNVTVMNRVLEQEEYLQCLKDKLLEETEEVLEAKSAQDIQDELADVLEVIHALGLAYGIAYEAIERVRLEKKRVKGGFEGRLYGTFLEYDADHPGVTYCLERPHKYPEVP